MADASSYWVHSGDVIFNNTNSEEWVGKTAYFPFAGKYVLSNHMTLIRVLDPKVVDAYWLAKELQYRFEQGLFKALCRRYVNQASVSLEHLKDIHIPCPPVSEQWSISKVLQTVQEAIQTRQDELDLEREREAALMEYLFTHGTRGEITKQTEIGDIPESWQVVELGEIITLHRGYDLPSRDRKPGIVPIISSSGISGTHSEAKVTAPGVITGRYGTIGEVFYIEQDFWPLNTTLYVSEFRRVTPHFVAYLLRTLNFNIFNDKSTVPGVNRNDLHRIKTVLPPPSEQQDIVDVLSAHDTKLSALEQETTLLEELFNALLEELMTGRLSTLSLFAEGETHE